MEFKYVDASKVNGLDEYMFSLVTGMITIKTLGGYHARLIDLGILTEDQMCRANTIIWDLTRMMRLYKEQADSVMEMLPEGFSVDEIIEKMKVQEKVRARKMLRTKT